MTLLPLGGGLAEELRRNRGVYENFIEECSCSDLHADKAEI
jgi:hypothetical protein